MPLRVVQAGRTDELGIPGILEPRDPRQISLQMPLNWILGLLSDSISLFVVFLNFSARLVLCLIL